MEADVILRTAVEAISVGGAAIGVLWRAAGRIKKMSDQFAAMKVSVDGLHVRMNTFDSNLQNHQKEDCTALEKLDEKLDAIDKTQGRIEERVEGVQKTVDTNNKAVHDRITNHYDRVTNQMKAEYRNIRDGQDNNRRR